MSKELKKISELLKERREKAFDDVEFSKKELGELIAAATAAYVISKENVRSGTTNIRGAEINEMEHFIKLASMGRTKFGRYTIEKMSTGMYKAAEVAEKKYKI